MARHKKVFAKFSHMVFRDDEGVRQAIVFYQYNICGQDLSGYS
jgi:hypothetical protein